MAAECFSEKCYSKRVRRETQKALHRTKFNGSGSRSPAVRRSFVTGVKGAKFQLTEHFYLHFYIERCVKLIVNLALIFFRRVLQVLPLKAA